MPLLRPLLRFLCLLPGLIALVWTPWLLLGLVAWFYLIPLVLIALHQALAPRLISWPARLESRLCPWPRLARAALLLRLAQQRREGQLASLDCPVAPPVDRFECVAVLAAAEASGDVDARAELLSRWPSHLKLKTRN
ncbi:MAG: hypothetical protein RL095_3925 [Verrucomicrobiota bacterium]|jgi:hypothetical protein